MKAEKRSHQRVRTKDIQVDISHSNTSDEETAVNAKILDISRTGIRIKLSKPLDASIHNKLSINMILPGTGDPFSIHGLLKHQHSETEYGLHYVDHAEESIDDMLFECVKLNDLTLLIKSL